MVPGTTTLTGTVKHTGDVEEPVLVSFYLIEIITVPNVYVLWKHLQSNGTL
jgi:hypothetical protein